jgi:DNA polymerase III epsilon subunit-like protein
VIWLNLRNWINQKAWCWANAEFYAYGDGDELFLKTTIKHLNSTFYELDALGFASYMCMSLKDCSKQIAKYFHRDTVRLIRAFNYIQENEATQKHDALEDAIMLRKVFEATNGKEPLAVDPWKEEIKKVIEKAEGYNESYGISPANYVFPCGKFYCRNAGKKVREREFENIVQAINWLIDLRVPKKDRDKVRRNKMAQHIMEAIRKNSTYSGYKWRRIKKG